MRSLVRLLKFSSQNTLHLSRRHASNTTPIQYCIGSVRQHDYENYLSTLLLPKETRHGAFVIRAFNIEVARVQDQVSEKTIGLMRLQFWIDTIEEIYAPKHDVFPAHPVAQQLRMVCQKYGLTKRYLMRMVNSRKTNIAKKYYESLEDMEAYSEESVSPIYYLLLELSGQQNIHCDHAASHLGKAQGLTNLLRSVEVLSQKRLVMLPLDLLLKHNVSQESVLRLADSKAMRDVVFEYASKANHHLTKARSITVPAEARCILLPAVAVDEYLKNLQKCDFNLFHNSLKKRNSLLPFSLYWNKLKSKY